MRRTRIRADDAGRNVTVVGAPKGRHRKLVRKNTPKRSGVKSKRRLEVRLKRKIGCLDGRFHEVLLRVIACI